MSPRDLTPGERAVVETCLDWVRGYARDCGCADRIEAAIVKEFSPPAAPKPYPAWDQSDGVGICARCDEPVEACRCPLPPSKGGEWPCQDQESASAHPGSEQCLANSPQATLDDTEAERGATSRGGTISGAPRSVSSAATPKGGDATDAMPLPERHGKNNPLPGSLASVTPGGGAEAPAPSPGQLKQRKSSKYPDREATEARRAVREIERLYCVQLGPDAENLVSVLLLKARGAGLRRAAEIARAEPAVLETSRAIRRDIALAIEREAGGGDA